MSCLGEWFRINQVPDRASKRHYGYSQYYEKARLHAQNFVEKTKFLYHYKLSSLSHAYYSGSMHQFNTLKQLGEPDRSFTEPKWDLYKITISKAPPGMYIFQCFCC